MKKLVTFLLLSIFSLLAKGQVEDPFYREIDWTFYPKTVSIVNDSTYSMNAKVYDYNEPGAGLEGNYVVDNVGHRYIVVSLIDNTLTVIDHYRYGVAPQTAQPAKVYKSVGNGDAKFVGSVDYSRLDPSTRWKLNGSDNELLYQKIIAPVDSIQFNPIQPNLVYKAGKVFYDTVQNTLSYYSNNIPVGIGKDLIVDADNYNSFSLERGRIVTVGVSDLGYPSAIYADSRYFDKTRLLAVMAKTAPSFTIGTAKITGVIDSLNTSMYYPGQRIYLGHDGYYTTEKPPEDEFTVYIGIAWGIDAVNGSILVNPQAFSNTSEVLSTSGFPEKQRQSCSISFDNTTRYFKIFPTVSEWSPAGDKFHYYHKGVKYEKTSADSVQVLDYSALSIIYYHEDTLKSEILLTSERGKEILENEVMVAFVVWDATAQTVTYLGEKRYRENTAPDTRSFLRTSLGSQILPDGFVLTDIIADGNGNSDAHAQFGVASGVVNDVDLQYALPNYVSTAGLPIYYSIGVGGGEWKRVYNSGFSVSNIGSPNGRLWYNENVGGVWQLTEVTDSKYVLCHVFATSDITDGTIAIMGQHEYANSSDARLGANNEIYQLQLNPFIRDEFIPIATVIFQTKDNMSNSVKAAIISTTGGGDYIDWRGARLVGYNVITDVPQSFLDLNDTPIDYALHANSPVKVNGAEDGLEFSVIDTTAQQINRANFTSFIRDKELDPIALDSINNNIRPDLSAHIGNTSNPHNVTKTQVGLGNVTNDAQVKRTEMGANNGVATLDNGGKIPSLQLPNTVMEYQGNWNPSTNIPYLEDGTGNTGDVYQAISDGDIDLGSGTLFFQTGDWAVYNGAIWEKSVNSNDVGSVNGLQGTVQLDLNGTGSTVSGYQIGITGSIPKVTLPNETDPVYSAWDKDYNDLINRPSIPTVYNSTITLQGTAVSSPPQSFTLNQSVGKTITINDNNTTYSAGTGLSLSGTTFNHSNAVTAGTAQGGSGTLTPGSSFTTPTVTYDAQGHVTAKNTNTYTLPSTYTPSSHTFGSHSDVTITSVTSGEIPKWNGSAWINNTLAEAGIQPQLNGTGFVKASGTTISYDNNSYLTSSDLDNVDLQFVTDNDSITTNSITANNITATGTGTFRGNVLIKKSFPILNLDDDYINQSGALLVFGNDTKEWRTALKYQGTGGDDYIIRDNTRGVNVLTLKGTDGSATFSNNITAGNGTADNSVTAYYSDGAYTRLAGIGVEFSRTASYLQPISNNSQSLYIGSPTHYWSSINFGTGTDNQMRISGSHVLVYPTPSAINEVTRYQDFTAGGIFDQSVYWKSDGSSIATGDWNISPYNIQHNSFLGNGVDYSANLADLDSLGFGGTGTQNYLSKFGTSGTSIVNSQIVDNGTNILIGGIGSIGAVTNKTVKLGLSSRYSSANGLQYNVMGFYGTTLDVTDIFAQTGTETSKNFFFGIVSDLGYFNSNRLSIINNGTEIFKAFKSGNIRIGSGSDNGGKLQVAKDVTANILTTSQLQLIGATNPNQRLVLGYNTDTNKGFIQSAINGVGYTPLALNQSGGNVLIGTTTDNGTDKLQVIGSGYFSGDLTANSFIKSGGTSSQFLKADGSVDGNSYLTTETDPTVPAYTKTLNSATKLLTEIKTVDGNGSGLDADLLDGKHAASFMEQYADLNTADLNDIKASGSYRVNPTCTNIPVAGRYYSMVVVGNESNVTSQRATDYQSGDTYIRAFNVAWSAWSKLWDDTDFSSTDVSNWNTAYGWGNHASGGYWKSDGSSTATGNWDISPYNFTAADKIETTGIGSKLTLYNGSGGYSTILGSRRYDSSSANRYGSYLAYDTYWDEPNRLWKAQRTTLSGKYKMEMGYILGGFSWDYYSGDASVGWLDEDWKRLMFLDKAGTLTLNGATDATLHINALTNEAIFRLQKAGTNKWGLATISNDLRIFNYTAGTDNIRLFESGNTSFGTSVDNGSRLQVYGDIFVSGIYTTSNTSSRDKIRVWSTAPYSIGMQTGFTFGGLNNDYAMTFQMSNTTGRGFWWGDDAHANYQGAMALTTDGKLTVAHSIRLGYGESDVTIPGTPYALDVNGSGYFSNAISSGGYTVYTEGNFPFGTDTYVPYMNGTSDGFSYSSNFRYTGSYLFSNKLCVGSTTYQATQINTSNIGIDDYLGYNAYYSSGWKAWRSSGYGGSLAMDENNGFMDLQVSSNSVTAAGQPLTMTTFKFYGNGTVDLPGNVKAPMTTPLQYFTSGSTNYYKIGNLSGQGARVSLKLVGQNGYTAASSNITYGTVSIGNADNVYGAWQYSIGDYTTVSNPTIIYKDNGGSTNIDVYIKIGAYFSGSLEIVNSYGFTLNSGYNTVVSDPSGINATISYNVMNAITASNFILDSDRRLKKNIKPIENIKNIDNIKFVSFNMKSDSTQLRYGVIAQDVEKIDSSLIRKDSKGMYSVAYIDLLIAKTARQDEQIKELKDMIWLLNQKLETLKDEK